MTSLTLYQIAADYRAITDVMMDSGCDEQTLKDTLEGEAWPMELKAQNYAFVIRNMEASSDAIKAAEQQMAERRKAIEKRAEYLKDRLKGAMELAGMQKIDCPHFAISIAKNPPSVNLYEPGLIPAEYMKTPEPPPPAPDKTAIKDAIKAGKEVPGAALKQGTSLRIK
jgi:hypothetical protein